MGGDLIRAVALLAGAALAASAAAAGADRVVIRGEPYALSTKLAKAGVAERFSAVARLDVAPSGRHAVAVRLDPDGTAELLALDLRRKRALRELWAWRIATHPGEWRGDGLYHFFGGSPGADRPEFRYDPKTNRIDGRY